MKTIVSHISAALILAICSSVFAAENFLAEVEAGLYKDPKGGIPSKLDKEKIIFFYFSSSTCGPCRRVTPLLLNLIDRHQDVAQLVHVNSDQKQEAMIRYWKKSKFNCPLISGDGDLPDKLMQRAGIDSGVPKVVAFLPDGTLLSNRGRELVGTFVGIEAFAPKRNEKWKALVEESQNRIKDRFENQIKSIREKTGHDLYLNYYSKVYWMETDPAFCIAARKEFIAKFTALKAKDKLEVMNGLTKIYDATITPEGSYAHPYWDMPELFFAMGKNDQSKPVTILWEQAPKSIRDVNDWPLAAYLLGHLSANPHADKSVAKRWRAEADGTANHAFEALFAAALSPSQKATEQQGAAKQPAPPGESK